MKNLIKFSYQLIITVLIIVSCNKSDDNLNTGNVKLTNYSHSECKSGNKESLVPESLVLKAISSNQLSITHKNTVFNCCPGEIKAEINVEQNLITLREYETESLCDCVCPYDLFLTLSQLVQKEYTIKIIKAGLNHFEYTFIFSPGLDTSIPVN